MSTVYSKTVVESITEGDLLDDMFEGKVYRWMLNNIDTKNEKTLFWIIDRRLTEEEVRKIIKSE